MRIQVYGWPLQSNDAPATSQDDLLVALREMRDVLLKESDWTQVPDNTLSEEIKNDWRIWRQSLRDITNTCPTPIPYVVDLGVPPAVGRPKSWDNWDLDAGANGWAVRPDENNG